MTLATDLDGKYTVLSQADNDHYRPKDSDGFTIIKGGKTSRIDGAGCEWNSTFTWLNESQVKMTSVVDPQYANGDFKLINSQGYATKEPQTYETTLSVKMENGLPVLSGVIDLGPEKVTIIMRKAKS
ncbi:MAG: hypothetical protein EBQ96_00520 [Proteobacteria bacterium]|nr:hypothetical protein [Pseudomonadota bacterium]